MDNSEYSLSQLMNLVNLKDRRSFTLNYLNPALENNVVVINRRVSSHYCIYMFWKHYSLLLSLNE